MLNLPIWPLLFLVVPSKAHPKLSINTFLKYYMDMQKHQLESFATHESFSEMLQQLLIFLNIFFISCTLHDLLIVSSEYFGVVYVTNWYPAFCLTFHLTGVHFRSELCNYCKAGWWRQWAKLQVWTNEKSGNNWYQIVTRTVCLVVIETI